MTQNLFLEEVLWLEMAATHEHFCHLLDGYVFVLAILLLEVGVLDDFCRADALRWVWLEADLQDLEQVQAGALVILL